MSVSITLAIPDDILVRYKQGATIAHMTLENFLVDRLVNMPLLLANDLPAPFDETLRDLEELADDALWEVAERQLSNPEQAEYEALLDKQSANVLTNIEQQRLADLGQQARLLTLKRAHAYMLLKWRGHSIPTPDDLLDL